MALISTPGAADANSYLSVAEANDYFTLRFQSSDVKWSDVADQAEALLATATGIIETFTFGATRTTKEQALAWPRSGLVDADGYTIPDDIIPSKLKYATCEVALWYYTEDDRAATDTDIDQLEASKIGPLDYKFKANAANFPARAMALLRSIGPGVLVSSGEVSTGGKKPGTFNLSR